MPRFECTLAKATVSKELASRACQVLQESFEPRGCPTEPAPLLVLDKKKTLNGIEGIRKEAVVEVVKRRFKEEFSRQDLGGDDQGNTDLLWGRPAVFQSYAKREIARTFPGAYHGLLALSDECDLPGGFQKRGVMGCGYYWDAESPVTWECKGGGYCISFAFAKIQKTQ